MRATWLGLGPLEFLLADILTFDWDSNETISCIPSATFGWSDIVAFALCVAVESRAKRRTWSHNSVIKIHKKVFVFSNECRFFMEIHFKNPFFPHSTITTISQSSNLSSGGVERPTRCSSIHSSSLMTIHSRLPAQLHRIPKMGIYIYFFFSSINLCMHRSCIRAYTIRLRLQRGDNTNGWRIFKKNWIGSWNGLMAFSYNFLYLPVFYDISIQLDTVIEFSLSPSIVIIEHVMRRNSHL